jgi:hypothetical protein
MLRSGAYTRRLNLGPQRFELGGLIAVGLVAMLMIWAAVLVTTGASTPPTPATTVTAGSADELHRLVAPIKHWVFWIGPKEGYKYELDQQADGTVVIRYLPPAGSAGLEVATYPFLGASLVIHALGQQSCCTAVVMPGAGSAESPNDNPNDVRVGFPGVDYQVEVYDPMPGSAKQLVSSGRLTPVPAG